MFGLLYVIVIALIGWLVVSIMEKHQAGPALLFLMAAIFGFMHITGLGFAKEPRPSRYDR
jgi:hypothetical protein